uniref:Major capsid protein N-terminal domain-containing protein n=1 Tax=viral metagenome TaxID=1070528 RepID=A0A6C0E7L3_9ZZZZ
MTGSILALAAVGKQDIELIGNPTIRFFKSVYRQYSHFSTESVQLQFDQTLGFGKKTSLIIPRRGDLLGSIILEIKLPALENGISWVNGIGHSLIEEISIEIGGVLIDRHSGEYLDIISQLEVESGKKDGYNEMIAKREFYTRFSQESGLTLYIPLQFWFCKEMSSAIPLVALQHNEVKIKVDLRPFNQTWFSGTLMSNKPTPVEIISGQLHCDFIYLDTEERRFFATKPHRYLIEQLQIRDGNGVNEGSSGDNIDIFLNHPVKDILWIYRADTVSNTNDWLNFSKTIYDEDDPEDLEEPLSRCGFQVNGHDLFEKKDADYFRKVVPYQKYTSTPNNYIYAYSFSQKPSKFQPCGHLNFSMISSAVLNLEYSSSIPKGIINIYARNYNILQIKNGQAGLLYSA